MGFFTEFRKFAMRGNVVDLAVGVIIGAAFGGVSKSLVDDVVMPPIGLALNNVDFKELYVPLDFDAYGKLKATLNEERREALKAKETAEKSGTTYLGVVPEEISPNLVQATEKGIPTLRYGAFLNTLINFVIVSFCVFILVKTLMSMQRKEPPKAASAPELTTSEKLLAEIRDELKGKKADPGKK